MSTASAALRAAIHDALNSDGALSALLGGAKVYDEPPQAAAFPYVTLGEARVSDFSTGTEPGEEHQLTLHAWSRQGGHREARLTKSPISAECRRASRFASHNSLQQSAVALRPRQF